VVIKEMPKKEALEMGAMALFGEKYGEKVRVVIIDPTFSVELCGGTHVGNTGMIGVFSIVSESAIAAGVRRIEALTGPAAIQYFSERVSLYKNITGLLKTKDPLKTIEKLLEEKNTLEKRIESLEARHLVQVRDELLHKDEIINGVTFVGDIVEVSSPDSLRKLCFDMKNKLNDYVVVVGANIGGKPYVAIGISETVAAARGLDAAKIVKEHIAPLVKGGGGGQQLLATAGGQDTAGLPLVIQKIRTLL
jgi:alanyl-tRNA synthetase